MTRISLATLLVLLGIGFVGATAGEAQVGEQTGSDVPAAAAGGPLLPLPDGRNEVLAGRVHLLGKTLDRAIDDLQHVELRQFAQSYKRMVDAYGQLADHVGDASSAIGLARTRVELAKRSLNSLDASHAPDSEQRGKLNEDIGQIRAMLIGKLGSLRALFEHAQGENKEKLLGQIQGFVGRIQQLDRLSAALRENTAPLVPGLTASNLREQLDVVEQTLDQEEQMLVVLSQSMKLLVDSTTGEMRHTMRLLEVSVQIPDEQMLQLSQTRAAVQTVLDEVAQAHARAADSAIEMLSKGTPPVTADPDELLRQVDQLLNTGR